MTKEEAIEMLKRAEIAKPIKFEDYADMKEALDMAIKALEQQPKTGHWIDIETLDGALWHECSECGETEFYATNYCPKCGVEMRGDKNAD